VNQEGAVKNRRLLLLKFKNISMKYLLSLLLLVVNFGYAQKTPKSVTEIALLKLLLKHQAENGLVIVKDVATDQVVDYVAFNSKAGKNGRVYYKDTALRYRYIEPGGFMIPISAAILMDNFGVSLNDTVDLESGATLLDGLKIVDMENHGVRSANLLRVIAENSNVGMTKFIKKHLLIGSSIINAKVEGYINNEEFILSTYDRAVDQAAASFGFGLMLTPNQVLTFYNRLAKNDTTLFNLPSTGPEVRKALLEVSKNGTSKALFRDAKFDIASKTGTILVLGKNGYIRDQFYSGMVGFAPYNNPKYSCIVVIKCKPHANQYYGSQVAGELFKEVMTKKLGNL
jgi:cell division protein FtsI (penicillin-binding protein 3)